MVQTIGKYYDSFRDKYMTGAIDVTYSANVAGTGNISVWTSNNTVIGCATVFSTQLGNGYVLRNSANVYIGKISNVVSNTQATLNTNSSITVGNLGFKYQTYSYTVINFDPSTWRFINNPFFGNGTINVSTSSSTIIGTNTAFLKQLTIGTQIFDSVNYDVGANLIGIVKSVYSNTVANLTTVASTTANNINYNYFDSSTNFSPQSPVSGFKSNIFNPRADTINSSLLEFSLSGLLQNRKQIKSFHPPVPDPVTGILVNFPASVVETKTIANIATYNYQQNHFGNLPNNQHDSEVHVVQHFDAENAIVGSSTKKAIDSIPINRILNKLKDKSTDASFNEDVKNIIDTIYGPTVAPPPPGIVVDSPPSGFTQMNTLSVIDNPYIAYQGPGGNVVYVYNSNVTTTLYNTISDRLALASNFPPLPRITQNRQETGAYFSVPDNSKILSDFERADLAARAGTKIQFTPDGIKRLAITGVPAVIPGQLNAILYDENPGNRVYTEPTYTKSQIQYNKQQSYVPVNSYNQPDATKTLSDPDKVTGSGPGGQ